MRTRVFGAAWLLATLLVSDALAICGDVTGDGLRLATDALVVLRAAVGQQVNLTCENPPDDGPSSLRFLNELTCNSGSSVSEARFNGFTFMADANEVSAYQSVDRVQIDSVEIDLCGLLFVYPGPMDLPPNRSITFYQVLLDPAVYSFPGIDIPGQFVLVDDGAAASALATGAIGGRSNVGYLYGGARY